MTWISEMIWRVKAKVGGLCVFCFFVLGGFSFFLFFLIKHRWSNSAIPTLAEEDVQLPNQLKWKGLSYAFLSSMLCKTAILLGVNLNLQHDDLWSDIDLP